MPTNEDKLAQIERYLDGEMTASEKTAFEAELQRNQDLAKAVALRQALHASLGNRQRRNLLDTLTDVVEQEDPEQPQGSSKWPTRFRLTLLLVVLLGIIGFWYYLKPGTQTLEPVKQPEPGLVPVPDSTPITSPPVQEDTPPKPRPMASADRSAFRPNPALDPLAGTGVRGGGMDVKVALPANDAVLPLSNGKINFRLRGSVNEGTALILHIYNNKEADFAAGKPVYQTEVTVHDQAFKFQTSLVLAPGRYYVVLYSREEEEPVVVRRIYAGSN